MRKINIAIDGPAAAGKSTICRLLAEKLGYLHINSGTFYRIIGFLLQKEGFIIEKNNNFFLNQKKNLNLTKLKQIWRSNNTFFDSTKNTFFVNKEEIFLYSNDLSIFASLVAVISFIRDFVTEKIKEIIAQQEGFIVDGRDAASKIIPDAKLKIFLDASIEKRALRRLADLQSRRRQEGERKLLKDVMDEILKRDLKDKQRKIDPLVIHKDSIRIDTSNLSIDQVVEKIIRLMNEI